MHCNYTRRSATYEYLPIFFLSIFWTLSHAPINVNDFQNAFQISRWFACQIYLYFLHVTARSAHFNMVQFYLYCSINCVRWFSVQIYFDIWQELWSLCRKMWRRSNTVTAQGTILLIWLLYANHNAKHLIKFMNFHAKCQFKCVRIAQEPNHTYCCVCKTLTTVA